MIGVLCLHLRWVPLFPHHIPLWCVPQGYGLTETCAASFVATADHDNSGTVGPPTSCARAHPLHALA